MAPGQLSRQWCDFLPVAISLVKLTHSKQVAASETPQPRLRLLQVISQLTDNSVAPFCLLQLAADIGANLPIQLNQLSVNCLCGLVASTLDQRQHFMEVAFVRVLGNIRRAHLNLS